MRRLLILFGFFDLSIVAIYANRIPGYASGARHGQWASIVCLAMMASLLVSAFGLIRGHAWAPILNYVQFPFRIAFAFLSFMWLAKLVTPAQASAAFTQAVWMSAIALEGIRLGLTINRGRRLSLHHLDRLAVSS
jgi:hypothetical protein